MLRFWWRDTTMHENRLVGSKPIFELKAKIEKQHFRKLQVDLPQKMLPHPKFHSSANKLV
jgi:hypothetical protein